MHAASESQLPVHVGDVVGGRFRILRVLGSGGMGTVVAAQHLALDHPIALKFIHRGIAHNVDAGRRFLREARAAARLHGEHVCHVLDVSELPDGSPYIVMEYLDGHDLGDLLALRGPLPVAEAVEYIFQTCEAMAEAHAAGIVHRDLKPQNLFLTTRPDGTPLVKILDFGISKLDDGSAPRRTATAVLMGSPAYMSPEQLRSAREVDARSDLWSIGVVLYELLAGRPPFVGENLPALTLAIVSESPPPLAFYRPEVPTALAEVVRRCLEKVPDRRIPSVVELAAALMPFASARANAAMTLAQAAPIAAPADRKGRPRASALAATKLAAPDSILPDAPASGRARWLALAGAVAVLVVGLFGWWWIADAPWWTGETGRERTQPGRSPSPVAAPIDATPLSTADEASFLESIPSEPLAHESAVDAGPATPAIPSQPARENRARGRRHQPAPAPAPDPVEQLELEFGPRK